VFESGKSIDAIVTHRDLYPSLSEITEVAPKKDLDGKSLLPLIDGQIDVLHSDPIFWDSGNKMVNWVVRDGDWKMVFRGKGRDYEAYQLDEIGLVKDEFRIVPIQSGMQLYNLAEDPGESKNLASANPERVQAMEKLYLDWRATMGEPISGKQAK
jgi:arylsulfatase A-like enzyme